MDFPKGDPTFFDFPGTQAGGSRPTKTLDTNPPLDSIPSPQLNFNFRGNMEANQLWLTVDAIIIPGAQQPLPKHPEKILPKFNLVNDVLPEDHIKQFMISLRLINVEHEYVFVQVVSIHIPRKIINLILHPFLEVYHFTKTI